MSKLNSGSTQAVLHQVPDGPEAELDADAIFAEFEAETDEHVSALLEQRLRSQQRQDEGPSLKSGSGMISTTSAKSGNVFVTLKSDKETLQFISESEKAVLLFFSPEFASCVIMESHLKTIARKHAESEESEVHFGRVNVDHAPSVAKATGTKWMPCVMGYINRAVTGRIRGFEGLLGNHNNRNAKSIRVCHDMEQTLVNWSIFKKALIGLKQEGADDDEESDQSDDAKRWNDSAKNGRRGIQSRKQLINDDDDDWD